MKNKLPLFLLCIISLILILSINAVSAQINQCSPTIQMVSQDPSPAVPNDYVKVLFEVSDFGNCKGLTVNLKQEYPFSLESNSSGIQSIEASPYASDYKNVWTIPYTIRIAPDAFDGDYSLKLQYHEGSNENFDLLGSYLEAGFNLTIKDSRTNFDAVIQEKSGNDISIAIANVGKYTANSVVVRIPDQDSFVASGTDGQMVGNLDSGDYTVVGFTLAQKMSSRNMTRNANRSTAPSNFSSQKTSLKFDIYYTDNIGERRIVNMELPLTLGNSSIGANGFARSTRNVASSTHWYSSWTTWAIIIALILIFYIFYRRNPEILKNLIHRKNKSANLTPSWISNAKKKERGR